MASHADWFTDPARAIAAMRAAVEASISVPVSRVDNVCVSGPDGRESGTIAPMPQKPRGSGAPGSARPSYPPLRATDADLRQPVAKLMSLVKRLNTGDRVPSENELSRRFADVIEALHLSTIVDTSPRGTKKRPDILAYRSKRDANVAQYADVVVESKPPTELHGVDITEALVGHLWADKTFPYITKNIYRIQYFILTTFVEYACVRITDQMRTAFAAAVARGDKDGGPELRQMVRACVQRLSLANVGRSSDQSEAERWLEWLDTHLRNLAFVPLSTIANARALVSRSDLEDFASQLAEVAAGPDDPQRRAPDAGLFMSLRTRMLEDEELARATELDLRLFIMSQNPSVDTTGAAKLVADDRARWVDEFIAASIHSLISRLFALTVIEDIYCVGEDEPLIERDLWVIRAAVYDGLTPDALRDAVTGRMRKLVESTNSLVQRMAVFGAFFNWITDQIDPISFRALFELFVIHNFRDLEGDLLGRFFEVYSQRINRTNRKQLGQYYTPLPVVRFMWSTALDELRTRGLLDCVTVLDPSTGSGAFLSEGAKQLSESRIPAFWQRLVGFDVSPQVLGIAQVNLYMAVLAQLPRDRAGDVRDLSIYTTDTLDPRNGKHLESIVPFFKDEAHQEFLKRSIAVSKEIKQQRHFWLIIGNPPYKNNSDATLKQMAGRFPRLLGESNADAHAQKRNIRDDYAWFFAAADHYVQGQGMIVFITSDSFLRHESYRLFRRELLRNYRVRRLVRLGESLFQDVSPDISFVVSVLLRRERPLEVETVDSPSDDSDDTAVEVNDIRGLVHGVAPSVLGTADDPRLIFLDAVATRAQALPTGSTARPNRDNGYALVPVERSLLERMTRDTVPIAGKGAEDRVFAKKWPGIITAFDDVLKDDDALTLRQRMFRFLGICQAERGNEIKLRKRIEAFADEQGMDDELKERAVLVALRAADQRITFDATKIKRSVSGSIPNSQRWYPPPEFRHFIYYEPAIKIPRNENVGKDVGWGSMEQWREHESHLTSPKLIFTSSSNPKYGYKAFVVDDEWYAKLHGGKSQQYNYTGLTIPSAQTTAAATPLNLGKSGARLQTMFSGHGRAHTAVLHYVAGIYNSAFAEAWLNAETGQGLRIKVPTSPAAQVVAVEVCDIARDLRDLHWLLYDGPKEGRVERDVLEGFATSALLRDLGVEWAGAGKRRFAQAQTYDLPSDWVTKLRTRIAEEQAALDVEVERLYE